MIRRREFIALLGSAAAAWPLTARAQVPPRLLRVGVPSTTPRTIYYLVAFEQRLHELGYVEGQNLAVEFISTGDRSDLIAEATHELIRRKVDVLLVAGEEFNLKTAVEATSTLPVVMIAINYDPVTLGYVTSIARPTGNVTGLYFRRPELVEKQVEVLAESFPEKTRLGVLWDANTAGMLSAAERAAASLRLELRPYKLENPPYDFVTALRALARDGAQMLLVLSSVYFNRDRPHIAALALQHGLPTMFLSKPYVEAGGLLSYGPSFTVMYRRAAEYVDRIAKGAKPSDLPIEQPTKFEMVVNLKTARALRLTLPPTLLVRADEVIE
jgi:putative ABC transport system substrate-binding protein